MEKLIYFLSGAIVILIFWVLRISIKLKMIKNDINNLHQKFEKLHNDIEILRGKLTQSQGIDLDLSVLENQIEENSQEMVSYIQQGIGEANKNLRYLEERVDKLEEELEDDSQKLSEIEEKIEEDEEEK